MASGDELALCEKEPSSKSSNGRPELDRDAFVKEFRKQQRIAMEELLMHQERQLNDLLDKHGLGDHRDSHKRKLNKERTITSKKVNDWWFHDIGFLKDKIMMVFEWWMALEEPKRTGRLAKFVKGSRFETFCVSVIVCNTIFILYSLNYMAKPDHLGDDPPNTLQVVEILFAIFYIVEICLRLAVHRWFFFVNKDMGWNNTDFLLVMLSTWHLIMTVAQEQAPVKLAFLRSFRIMKLARLLRLIRVIRFFRDLRVMLDAFLSSIIALMWCMVLMIFTIAMFALIFVQLSSDWVAEHMDGYSWTDERVQYLQGYFGSVQKAMLTLYMATTGGEDWAVIYNGLRVTGDGTGLIFVFYTAFYYFGVFNLLTGMFVDKAVKASQPDADMLIVETRAREEATIAAIEQVCELEGIGYDGMLDAEDLERLLRHEKMSNLLMDSGLDLTDAKVLFRMMGSVAPKVATASFIRGCMRMKGAATSIDLQALQCEIRIMREEHMQSVLRNRTHMENLEQSLSLHGVRRVTTRRPSDQHPECDLAHESSPDGLTSRFQKSVADQEVPSDGSMRL